jgi:hypothetical protein
MVSGLTVENDDWPAGTRRFVMDHDIPDLAFHAALSFPPDKYCADTYGEPSRSAEILPAPGMTRGGTGSIGAAVWVINDSQHYGIAAHGLLGRLSQTGTYPLVIGSNPLVTFLINVD